MSSIWQSPPREHYDTLGNQGALQISASLKRLPTIPDLQWHGPDFYISKIWHTPMQRINSGLRQKQIFSETPWMSAIGGKADLDIQASECLLLAKSGPSGGKAALSHRASPGGEGFQASLRPPLCRPHG